MKSLKTRIMVFGTFDIFHKGHESFLKQARKLSKNPFLIVSIARDVNVKKIKGAKPVSSDLKRKTGVVKSNLADKVVLGGVNNYLNHIVKEKPEIIGLGYDQKAYTKNLKQALKEKGLNVKVVWLKPHKPHIYKTSLVRTRNMKHKT